jgi:GntR family transcriptional regulator
MGRQQRPAHWNLTPPDPASAVPLHAQTENQLRERITSGTWPPGMKMPSERELIALLGVSRTTIRQALDALLHAGLLDRRHGSGTYVAPVRFVQPLDSVYSFTEQFRKRGIVLENTVRRCEVIPAPADIAAQLGIAAGDAVVYLERIRSVRGSPVMLIYLYLPLHFVPSLTDEREFVSLYTLLRERYGLVVQRAEDQLESIAASGQIAALLGVRRHAPLMLVERIAYTRTAGGEVPLHVGRIFIRGDACRFQTELTALIYKDE